MGRKRKDTGLVDRVEWDEGERRDYGGAESAGESGAVNRIDELGV